MIKVTNWAECYQKHDCVSSDDTTEKNQVFVNDFGQHNLKGFSKVFNGQFIKGRIIM